jgi:hypothetical protein
VAENQQAVNLVGEAPDEGAAATGGAGCGDRRLLAGGGIRAARECAVAALHEHVTGSNLTDSLLYP